MTTDDFDETITDITNVLRAASTQFELGNGTMGNILLRSAHVSLEGLRQDRWADEDEELSV